MAIISGSPMIGTAAVVYGSVRVESADGVMKVLQPNEPINLYDRIDTGHDGSVTIVFSDGTDALELGRMTDMVVDHDVFQTGGDLDTADATLAPDLLHVLLQDTDFLAQVSAPENILPGLAAGGDNSDPVDSDVLVNAPEQIDVVGGGEEMVSAESGDGDLDPGDDSLDLSHLIPPLDDAS